MTEILVPLGLFAAIVGTIWLFSHFNYLRRKVAHETVRHAIDKGQDVSPDLIEKMSLFVDAVRADLRRGVIFIAIGLGFVVLAFLVGQEEPEAVRPLVGIASFPLLLGLAYLALWKFAHGDEQ